MTEIEALERMLSQVQAGAPIAYLSESPKSFDHAYTVECHFNFEPRLRYLRYITSFNRVLDNYTNFKFNVVAIKKGCIDVFYYAENFEIAKKNLVKRQILKLMKERNVQQEFCISSFFIFQKRYDNNGAQDRKGID